MKKSKKNKKHLREQAIKENLDEWQRIERRAFRAGYLQGLEASMITAQRMFDKRWGIEHCKDATRIVLKIYEFLSEKALRDPCL